MAIVNYDGGSSSAKKPIKKPVVTTQPSTGSGSAGSTGNTATKGNLQPVYTTQPVTPVASVQSTTPTTQTTPAASTQSAQTTSTTQRGGISEDTYAKMNATYTPSQEVQDAYTRLQQIASGKPGEYQSQWQDTINQLYGQMQGRDPFSYDAAKDPLYLQYRALYAQQGRNAMMDTMGQAAGLTGGYGSTYSQNAGQQAYDSYLQQLNEVVPELAEAAYTRYQNEGDELYRQYQLAKANEESDYSRYRDTVSDWENERSDARTAYDSAYNKDYGQYSDAVSRAYTLGQMENSDYWQQVQMDYQKERDKVADEQWQKQYDLSRSSRSSGGGSGGSSKSSEDEASTTNFGSGIDPRGMSTIVTELKMTYKSKGADAAEKVLDKYADQLTGKLSEEQFYTLLGYAEGKLK